MSLVFNMVGGGSGGGGGADKVMTQGQVSSTSAYMTATFDNPISDFGLVEVHLFRGGVDVGKNAAIVPASGSTTFYITGGGYQYTMVLTSTTIKCTNYAGSYTNLYVDVYAYVSIAD